MKTNKNNNMAKRNITSFVTRQMLLGNISTLGISRTEIERSLEKFSTEHPKVDVTAMPFVGISLNLSVGDKLKQSKALIALGKKHCGRKGSGTAIFSKDFHSMILFGPTAKEIVSKITFPKTAALQHLKTKIKIVGELPLNKKLKCFGGEKISDYIKK